MNKKTIEPVSARPGIREGLAARQVRITLIIALFVGFIMAVFQILTDYKNERQAITHNLQQVFDSTVLTAAESVWKLDTALANGVTRGLVSHPLIAEAGIKTNTDTILSQQKKPDNESVQTAKYTFLFGESSTVNIPLNHEANDNDIFIGTLWLVVDPSMARKVFLERVVFIMVSGILKALILAGVLLIVFHATLTRPIQKYARWIALIDPKKPENWTLQPPERVRQDELTEFGEMAAQRFHQARDNFLELQQTRNELKQLNQVLETRVQERTQDLETALSKAEYLATTDELTGIPNRRYFMQRAHQRHSEWVRHGHLYALLMIDLDHFKQINDQFGHFAGDEVLKAVAIALQKTCRTEDVIGRIGGEEFCILLVSAGRDESEMLAQRLLKELSELPILVDQQTISITASLGLAWPENADEEFDTTLKTADKLLYDAKQAGRNRVCSVSTTA